MNTGAKHVAGAGRVDGVDFERRRVMHAVAIERHRTALAERDAQHAMMRLLQRAERFFLIVEAGDARRHVLGEDRDADRVDELLGAIGDAIDVARDRHSVLARDLGRANRRRLIHIVDVQDARARNRFRPECRVRASSAARRDPRARCDRRWFRRRG